MAKQPPSANRRAKAATAVPPSNTADRRDWIVAIVMMVAAATVYLDTIGGDFVYDDARQILQNSFIQDGRYFWRALFSDVWAFKGTSGGRVSNYWRPSFVLWLIANVKMFGLMSTVGWHVGNIALHVLATGLAFALLRRLRVPCMTAGAIALLFAVHPVHVESVAWISGSPDLILAPALLASTWFLLNTIERPTLSNWCGAIACYAVAQGAKEIAIFFPVIAALAVRASLSVSSPSRASSGERAPTQGSWSLAIKRAVPFAALAVVYLLARSSVLGRASAAGSGGTEWIADVCSAPQVGAFYLRQIVFPLWIGPSYPMRPVVPDTIDWMNFGVPLVVCVIAGAWMLREAKKRDIAALGLAIFVLPLAPAMHVSAFLPEQVVHDRYLYLPLLGFLMIAVPAVARLAIRFAPQSSDENAQSDAAQTANTGPVSVMALAAVCAAPLSFQTYRYSTAWMSEVALWEWGVESDPQSVFNYTQLAEHRRFAAKPRSSTPDLAGLVAARAAADRAIELAGGPSDLPRPELISALLVRADIATDQGRHADAEADLRRALEKLGPDSKSDDVFKAYTRLAVCFDRQQRLVDAEAVLREAHARLAHKRCALTEKLGVVLYRVGRKEDALRELESVRTLVPSEFSFDSRLVLFRLGHLYQEMGRPRESQTAFREFLTLTAGIPGEDVLGHRAIALKALGGG
jgi:tetratricopeptide (TPR) repeat protein